MRITIRMFEPKTIREQLRVFLGTFDDNGLFIDSHTYLLPSTQHNAIETYFAVYSATRRPELNDICYARKSAFQPLVHATGYVTPINPQQSRKMWSHKYASPTNNLFETNQIASGDTTPK